MFIVRVTDPETLDYYHHPSLPPCSDTSFSSTRSPPKKLGLSRPPSPLPPVRPPPHHSCALFLLERTESRGRLPARRDGDSRRPSARRRKAHNTYSISRPRVRLVGLDVRCAAQKHPNIDATARVSNWPIPCKPAATHTQKKQKSPAKITTQTGPCVHTKQSSRSRPDVSAADQPNPQS